MAEKQLTSVSTSTTMADTDSVFANVSNAVRQITLANLIALIESKLTDADEVSY